MHVQITCDVQQVDETGYVWTLLDEAADPERIVPGAVVVAGDEDSPVCARVVDLVGTGSERRVHLDILPARPGG